MSDALNADLPGPEDDPPAAPGAAAAAATAPAPAAARPQIRLARFGELAESSPLNGSETLDLLMDVGLSVTVELGRTEMPVRDVLGLVPGSVIELRRSAAEPVDIFVNNKVVARGEVVVVDDRFGVRITELVGG